MIKNPLENELWKSKERILGLDEAGRGPIAGPLVVAGVIFPKGYQNDRIDDSKKLSEAKREQLFLEIQRDALAYKILCVSEEQIDTLNIYRATQWAMETIAQELSSDFVLSDAMPLPSCSTKSEAIIKGDQKSLSIAAASILAKVSRDHFMDRLDRLYPEYGFQKHKGYPTKQHLENLHRFGLLPIYRHSYRPVKEMEEITLF